MCAGGEYRGVRHDRHFNAPSPQHSLSTRALCGNRCRAEEPEQATLRGVCDLANRGNARDRIRRSSRQKTGVLRYRRNHGGHMAKTRISSTDLAWIFQEKLNAFDGCPPAVSIAIVPTDDDGWAAATTATGRAGHHLCARRIEQIQKQLRGIYVLAKD